MLPLFNLVDAVGIEPTMFLMYWILSPVRLSQFRHARMLSSSSRAARRPPLQIIIGACSKCSFCFY